MTFTVDPGGDKKKACYYLPWGGDRAYRIRLDSKTIPRVFFTAALDGCSVVVEGNVMLPSVYHANAAGTLPKQSPIGDTSCLEKIALGVISKRNEVMFGACAAFPADWNAWYLQHQSDFPDLVKSAAAVTALEYGVLIGRQSAKQELRAAMSQPIVAKQLLESQKFVQSSGSVFGVLGDDERWHFYMQRVVELDNGEFAVLRCVEFWPTGFSRSLDNP
ncbi:hypothetical protein DB30_01486 [Enhygromyxa salina]|uniref:Uncharacterized protein n=1 Tax=Enhygromyxa salina TaxID=215803 RepID=A0A0C2CMC3_9BACT|nr:hypothetical protein [Enhygromyxa salina]KIG12411.1 hypothetical protein DB30_01486 [Enhygromyxa salina]